MEGPDPLWLASTSELQRNPGIGKGLQKALGRLPFKGQNWSLWYPTGRGHLS